MTNSTGKFNALWQVLTTIRDRFLDDKDNELVDPTYESLDGCISRCLAHVTATPKRQEDQTLMIVLCPKSTRPKVMMKSPPPPLPPHTVGSQDKAKKGMKRKASEIDQENNDGNGIIEIVDEDDSAPGENDSNNVDVMIKTRFFITNGPMIDGKRLVKCPNTLDKAQGDWSDLRKLPSSLLYSNSNVIENLVQYAQMRTVDFEDYEPYRASTVIRGIMLQLLTKVTKH